MKHKIVLIYKAVQMSLGSDNLPLHGYDHWGEKRTFITPKEKGLSDCGSLHVPEDKGISLGLLLNIHTYCFHVGYTITHSSVD